MLSSLLCVCLISFRSRLFSFYGWGVFVRALVCVLCLTVEQVREGGASGPLAASMLPPHYASDDLSGALVDVGPRGRIVFNRQFDKSSHTSCPPIIIRHVVTRHVIRFGQAIRINGFVMRLFIDCLQFPCSVAEEPHITRKRRRRKNTHTYRVMVGGEKVGVFQ